MPSSTALALGAAAKAAGYLCTLHLHPLFGVSILVAGNLFQRQPWHNVHRLKLLEEQLAGVRNLERRDVLRGHAHVAPGFVTQDSALGADVYHKLVGRVPSNR